MEMQAEGAMPVEQAATMAGALEPQAEGVVPQGEPLGEAPVKGTFNGSITVNGETRQVTSGVLQEGANRLYVSDSGQIVFNEKKQILGGRSPDGTFTPSDGRLLFLLTVSGGSNV